MSKARKQQSHTSSKSSQKPLPKRDEMPLEKQAERESQINSWSLFYRSLAISISVFVVGMFLTLISTKAYHFTELPHKGQIQLTLTGKQVFYPYYPTLRKFALLEDPSQPGSKSLFTQIGTLGTSLFVYTILNTFHWIMEIGFASLGGMILIPIITLLMGSALFFFKMLPLSMQKPDHALTTGIGIALLHAVLLIVFFLLAVQISSTFQSMFSGKYFYSGDVIMTTIRAGIPILLLTNFTYGVIAGGMLYGLIQIRAFLRG